jgi:hypothetical protein
VQCSSQAEEQREMVGFDSQVISEARLHVEIGGERKK